jgi:hypothetical protein
MDAKLGPYIHKIWEFSQQVLFEWLTANTNACQVKNNCHNNPNPDFIILLKLNMQICVAKRHNECAQKLPQH